MCFCQSVTLFLLISRSAAQSTPANNSLQQLIEKEKEEAKLIQLYNEMTGPDQRPTGVHNNEKPFTVKEFDVLSQDTIVTYTDGHPDQSGGIRGKKLMYRQYKEVILTATARANENRAEFLAGEFDRWKPDCSQIDDIGVMGVKI